MDIIIPYLNYLSIGELFPGYSYFYHLIWCSQNLFQMQFYRKLFYNLYWKNIDAADKSLTSKWLLFTISLVLSCFFSMFYNPADPAHSNSQSSFLKFTRKIYKRVSKGFTSFLNYIISKHIHFIEAVSFKTGHRMLALNSVWRI